MGPDRLVRELRAMLELRHVVRETKVMHHGRRVSVKATSAPEVASNDWETPILKMIAVRDQGVAELWSAIASHRSFLDRKD